MRFGRTAGLTKDEIKRIGRLDREDFDERTWIALNWVRTWLLFEGAFPDRSVDDRFRAAYQPHEQKDLIAILKLMLFFNMTMNLFDKKGSRLLKTP